MAKIWGKLGGEMSRLRSGIVNLLNGLELIGDEGCWKN